MGSGDRVQLITKEDGVVANAGNDNMEITWDDFLLEEQQKAA